MGHLFQTIIACIDCIVIGLYRHEAQPEFELESDYIDCQQKSWVQYSIRYDDTKCA